MVSSRKSRGAGMVGVWEATGREEGDRTGKALQAVVRNLGCVIRALSPFSRYKTQDSERLTTLPKVTQLVSGRAEI